MSEMQSEVLMVGGKSTIDDVPGVFRSVLSVSELPFSNKSPMPTIKEFAKHVVDGTHDMWKSHGGVLPVVIMLTDKGVSVIDVGVYIEKKKENMLKLAIRNIVKNFKTDKEPRDVKAVIVVTETKFVSKENMEKAMSKKKQPKLSRGIVLYMETRSENKVMLIPIIRGKMKKDTKWQDGEVPMFKDILDKDVYGYA